MTNFLENASKILSTFCPSPGSSNFDKNNFKAAKISPPEKSILDKYNSRTFKENSSSYPKISPIAPGSIHVSFFKKLVRASGESSEITPSSHSDFNPDFLLALNFIIASSIYHFLVSTSVMPYKPSRDFPVFAPSRN